MRFFLRATGALHVASVLMLRLSYPTETVLSNKITRNRIVISFKDSPRKPLGRRPEDWRGEKIGSHDSSVGFVTDITITNDVTFDFNSSKTEKEIIVITAAEPTFLPISLFLHFILYFFLQAVEHEGFIPGDTSFQIKRENGECVVVGETHGYQYV